MDISIRKCPYRQFHGIRSTRGYQLRLYSIRCKCRWSGTDIRNGCRDNLGCTSVGIINHVEFPTKRELYPRQRVDWSQRACRSRNFTNTVWIFTFCLFAAIVMDYRDTRQYGPLGCIRAHTSDTR